MFNYSPHKTFVLYGNFDDNTIRKILYLYKRKDMYNALKNYALINWHNPKKF